MRKDLSLYKIYAGIGAFPDVSFALNHFNANWKKEFPNKERTKYFQIEKASKCTLQCFESCTKTWNNVKLISYTVELKGNQFASIFQLEKNEIILAN